MRKPTQMEETMIETDPDLEIIIGKFKRKMDTLTTSNQRASTSKNVENWGARNVENQGFGGGILQEVILDVMNDPYISQETRKVMEIYQMNRTIRQIQNEKTRLRRGENLSPTNKNPRILSQKQRRNPIHENRIINDDRIKEYRKREPRVPNPNVVISEEIGFEEIFDNFDQEAKIIQD